MNATTLATRTAPAGTPTSGAASAVRQAASPRIPVTATPLESVAPTRIATPLRGSAPVDPSAGFGPREPDGRALDRLAIAIDADGIAAHEAAVTGVLAAARSAAVCSVLVQVLADTREPAVARERAFGRIAAALAARPAER